MTETATTTPDRQPSPDSGIKSPEEILDSDFRSLHARLYIAATDDGEEEGGLDIAKIFNPETPIPRPDPAEPSDKFIDEDQDYNVITWGMSKKERLASWEGVDYDTAMEQWKEGLFRSIHNSSHDNIVKGFFGKDKSEITREGDDIQRLYDTYCKGESNVTAFARKAIDAGATEDEAKWLARKLFGAKTAEVVVEIMELELSIKANEKETFDVLFGGDEKMQRVNEPNEKEKKLYKNIAEGFEFLTTNEQNEIKYGRKTQSSSTNSAPLEGPKEDEEQKEKDQLPELKENMIIINKAGKRYYIGRIGGYDSSVAEDINDYETRAHLVDVENKNNAGDSPTKEELQRALIKEDSNYRFSIVEGKQIEFKGETYTATAEYLEKEKGEVVMIQRPGEKRLYFKRAKFDELRNNKTVKIIGIDDVEESEDQTDPQNEPESTSPNKDHTPSAENTQEYTDDKGNKYKVEKREDEEKPYLISDKNNTEGIELTEEELNGLIEQAGLKPIENESPDQDDSSPPPGGDAGDGPNPEAQDDADQSDSDVNAPADGEAKKK